MSLDFETWALIGAFVVAFYALFVGFTQDPF